MPLSELPELALPFETASAPATPHRHVVLPYAAQLSDSCQHVLQSLQLPHLERLLQMMTLSHTDEDSEGSAIPPHERTVARSWGLDPQAPAWAAIANAHTDSACAWMTLCHLTVGSDQVRLDDPAVLPIDMQDAQTLHAILQPWFEEDGLTLQIVQPGRWLITGAPLEALNTASIDRVVLRDASPWLPTLQNARKLYRLQSEVQMLLYTHRFNQERIEHGLQPVNGFWLHGAGQLTPAQLAHTRPPVEVATALRKAALRQHWPAWKQAWLQTDAGILAELVQHVAAGGPATLTLCGERNARTYTTQPRKLLQKIKNMWSPQRFADLHQAL